MVNKKTWKEFKESGLLWWINTILHTFGWAICLEYSDDDIVAAYPARVKFRGFNVDINDLGYYNVTKYLKENMEEIYKETL